MGEETGLACWSSQNTKVESPVICLHLCYTYNGFFFWRRGKGKVTVVISCLGVWLILGISICEDVKSNMCFGVRGTQKHRMDQVGRDPVTHLLQQGHPWAHCGGLLQTIYLTMGPAFILCFPFVIDVFEESTFVVLGILVQIQFHMGLCLSCLISTYSDTLSKFIPSDLTLLPAPVYFLLTVE